jgi:hypothetical protein
MISCLFNNFKYSSLNEIESFPTHRLATRVSRGANLLDGYRRKRKGNNYFHSPRSGLLRNPHAGLFLLNGYRRKRDKPINVPTEIDVHTPAAVRAALRKQK